MNIHRTLVRSPLRLLLLCDFNERSASTIIDHIHGLRDFSEHSILILQSIGEISEEIELDRFDGLIIHYSLVACMDTYIGPNTRAAIRRFAGIKAAFVQDDYRFIDRTVEALRDLEIHILFGLAPSDIIDEIYPPEKLPGVVRETVLAGYVPEQLTKLAVPSFSDRPVDVGYRARKLPAWLGSHGQEKWIIANRFMPDARQFDLKCDISTKEEDRIYGSDWIKFLSNCKAVLGTESGSSVCDFTGEIQRKVEAHVACHRDSFERLRDLYFKEDDGRVVLSVISPRCFEAAALRTLMILYEGEYSGRLLPWRHYVPLKKDHSNMEEVVSVLRDARRAQSIIETAFYEVALNPDNWFSAMVRQVDGVINTTFRQEMVGQKPAYNENMLDAILTRHRRRQAYRRFRSRLGVEFVGAVRRGAPYVPARLRRSLKDILVRIWPGIKNV
jgi:hypothetical protein